MTRTQYLLLNVMEECQEVAHRASKAIRYGLDEIQPGQSEDNYTRLMMEYADLVATMVEVQRLRDLHSPPGWMERQFRKRDRMLQEIEVRGLR